MLVSVNWLGDYIDLDNISIEEFCSKMILSGSNIETVEPMGTKFSKIMVGHILKIEKHPNADKLVVCTVDVGEDEPVVIVTGARNVFEGAYVPVIRHGGKLPDGTTIKKGKLRGVESNGMLCSAAEMGYEDKVIDTRIKDGIWILEDEDMDLTPGVDIAEALGLKDSVVDFEITPNRPDCLSMLGMAREAAAVFGKKMKYPDTAVQNETGSAEDYISVEVKRPDLCPRFTARVIKNVKIGPSPWWLQKRLMHGGMRPINNIVDITNFVMLEYGQPIHAYDIREIEGGRIVVDAAKEGEKFTTLDGNERTLSDGMLMINDSKKAIGVAGVMGGLNSEIKDDTQTVVIEAANFSGDSVRRTSKKLALRTEASSRFEKGIDPNLCREANDRVCRLVEILGCGQVAGGAIDIYPEVFEAKPLNVRASRINRILGTDISKAEMESIFKSLEISVEDSGEDVMRVTPPTVRQDLGIEEDYVEEVARMYGYDRLPVTLPAGGAAASMTQAEVLRTKARDILTGFGLDEVLTYSFVSPSCVDKINISETDIVKRNFVRIMNPLGEDTSVMRTMLTPNMMEVLSKNNSKGNKSVRMFEIGRIFNDVKINCDGQPTEAEGLCMGMYGGGADFFELKGYTDELLRLLGIRGVRYERETRLGMYHPGRCANIIAGGELLGTMGEMHPDAAAAYGISERVYTCELLFTVIMRSASTDIRYVPLPKYPSVTRDIALIVDESVSAGRITDIIRENGEGLLESAELFDVYRGKQIEEGKKSVAFSLTYRDMNKTLTDEEVVKVHEKILKGLRGELNAVLRDM